jgi:hypothetical protein
LVLECLAVRPLPVTIPLSSAAPAIFTVDSSGKGQGLVFNAGFSLNAPNNLLRAVPKSFFTRPA